jgi:hypothetical protein
MYVYPRNTSALVLFLLAQLLEGLRQDRDDAIPLRYTRCPSAGIDDNDDDQWESDEDEIDERLSYSLDAMVEDVLSPRTTALVRKRPPSRQSSPPLPISPISNPSSSMRKRRRSSNWEPPEHIPDFLPPFPSTSEDSSPPPVDRVPSPPTVHSIKPLPTQPSQFKLEKQLETLPQSLTTSAVSDILVQVPYSQSSLSSVPGWYLPSAPPPTAAPTQTRVRQATPQIEPALIAAYHHILTHPPPPNPPPLNLSRHKVLMALLKQAESTPRWNPADTLFGSVGPCPPRVSTIGPSYPVAIGNPTVNDIKGKSDAKDNDVKLPPAIPRPVSAIEHIAPFISQQSSRIPDLARHVLPVIAKLISPLFINLIFYYLAFNLGAYKPPFPPSCPPPRVQTSHLRHRYSRTLECQPFTLHFQHRSIRNTSSSQTHA